jgi:iron complex transport system substrate-binding protein
VWVSEAARLADIARLLRAAGQLGGEPAAGARAADDFEHALRELQQRHGAPSRARVRVFYEIWHQPLLTVNGAHMISDAIALCGGANVFAGVPVLTPAVSLEAVLAAHPQLVLGGGSANGEADFAARWRTMPLAALRAIPAHYLAPDSIQRQSPRIIGGIRAICARLAAVRESQEISSR